MLVGALLLSIPIVGTTATGSQGLFVPSDSPYGKTFLDWAKEWLQPNIRTQLQGTKTGDTLISFSRNHSLLKT